ncbi:MAG: hypothetical protein LBV12_03920 [Puniceicoccales bacterium]|jgi:hypothetical protein|nr:hypothetical protein [Puniceicoccales bacterium]
MKTILLPLLVFTVSGFCPLWGSAQPAPETPVEAKEPERIPYSPEVAPARDDPDFEKKAKALDFTPEMKDELRVFYLVHYDNVFSPVPVSGGFISAKRLQERIKAMVPFCREALGKRLVPLLCRRIESGGKSDEVKLLQKVYSKYQDQLTEEEKWQVFYTLFWAGGFADIRGVDDVKLKNFAEKMVDASSYRYPLEAENLYESLRKTLPEPVRMAKGKLTVRVVDEEGNPMDRVQVYFRNFKDAKGRPTYVIYRKTDAKGRVTLEHETSSPRWYYSADEIFETSDGSDIRHRRDYYSDRGNYYRFESEPKEGRWQPENAEVTLVLKKKTNPVAMYVKNTGALANKLLASSTSLTRYVDVETGGWVRKGGYFDFPIPVRSAIPPQGLSRQKENHGRDQIGLYAILLRLGEDAGWDDPAWTGPVLWL